MKVLDNVIAFLSQALYIGQTSKFKLNVKKFHLDKDNLLESIKIKLKEYCG